ncbi:hypothetical protein PHISCL_00160 [Aspergillus sclerotialis]|uniref:Uncharacterized protein n=1 Tax=Aspergillus sclerotialis TaxID=2070753 RepID=A0A3A3A783_9EURO|nr:hypothetical protein PHISCL_00160 [Aspergillus sclerotialis]
MGRVQDTISRLCNLQASESIRASGNGFFNVGMNDGLSKLPEYMSSIPRFSVSVLDDAIIRLIKRIGDDPSRPPAFMCELYFDKCLVSNNFLPCMTFKRRDTWPTLFSVNSFKESPSHTIKLRRKVIRGISLWIGLRRLHLPVNLDYRVERDMVIHLVKRLRERLGVLSLETEVRSFTGPGYYLYRESDVFGDAEDLNIYRKDTLASIQPCVLRARPKTSALRLNFTKALCLSGRLHFLGIFNTYFEVHNNLDEGEDSEVDTVASHLHQVTLSKLESATWYRYLFS